ncbi:HU family DNA-binding protein [Spiroplasma endosymbiont of Acasis viretata]|uniref:HU family DNA-binding protein n=1 Tax=Spiroplasma endosymbiont of Acasis viretata TaxID=3066306 RepID=UPI00313DE3C6
MNAKELIARVSDKTKFNIQDIEIVFNCVIEEIKNINQLGKVITISNFGTFKIKKVKPCLRRNSKNNGQHVVSKYKYIKFIPYKKYKKYIRCKPKPTILNKIDY